VANQGNSELRLLTNAMEKIRYAGSWTPVEHLSVNGLLPSTKNYMTYEAARSSEAAPGDEEVSESADGQQFSASSANVPSTGSHQYRFFQQSATQLPIHV
ncbi:hypothetical protein SK128_026308, partial [Halocaridina rubra]